MKHVSANLQARVRLAQDEACREVTAKAAVARAETAAALASFATLLTETRSQLVTVGKTLRELE